MKLTKFLLTPLVLLGFSNISLAGDNLNVVTKLAVQPQSCQAEYNSDGIKIPCIDIIHSDRSISTHSLFLSASSQNGFVLSNNQLNNSDNINRLCLSTYDMKEGVISVPCLTDSIESKNYKLSLRRNINEFVIEKKELSPKKAMRGYWGYWGSSRLPYDTSIYINGGSGGVSSAKKFKIDSRKRICVSTYNNKNVDYGKVYIDFYKDSFWGNDQSANLHAVNNNTPSEYSFLLSSGTYYFYIYPEKYGVIAKFGISVKEC
jgi:hypothetical protein